ncbi:MAG: ion channel [Asticcacaulis sp.]
MTADSSPSNGKPEPLDLVYEPDAVPAPEAQADTLAETAGKAANTYRPRLVPRPGGPRPRIIIRGRRRLFFNDLYAQLMDASWPKLVGVFISTFLCINTLFAVLYFALGDWWPGEGIAHARHGYFLDDFFFSVQTLATIGYGGMSPEGIVANVLVTLEAVTGFSFYALMTGLVFSKFSRPTARVTFSERAVINDDMGSRHFSLRMINDRGNRIVNAEARLVMMRDDQLTDGSIMRRYYDLPLVRSTVPIMQLSWSLLHRIDETSPLYGETLQSLEDKNAEIIVSMTGMDESLSSTIHTRFSYIAGDISFDRSFAQILHRLPDNTLEVHYDKIHDLKD